MSNCNEFQVDENILYELRNQRNSHCHEGIPSLKCSAKDKTKIFDTLRDLLRDPDVINSQTVAPVLPNILQDLQRIEDGDNDLAKKYELDEELIKMFMPEQRKQMNLILKKLNQIILFIFFIVIGVGVYMYSNSDLISSFKASDNQKQQLRKHGKFLGASIYKKEMRMPVSCRNKKKTYGFNEFFFCGPFNHISII